MMFLHFVLMGFFTSYVKDLSVSVLFIRMSKDVSGRKHGPSFRQQGFTLIEVMVVVAIVAILAVIASPGIEQSLKRQRNRENTQTVVSAMREARAQSQLLQKDVSLTIAGNKIDVKSTNFVKATIPLYSYELNKKVAVRSNKNTIVFRPNKTVNQATVVTIYCDEKATQVGRKVHLDVNGNVAIKEEGSQC